jgi:hypothetical protein
MPVLVDEHDRLGTLARATNRLDEIWASARHLAERLTGRGVPDSAIVDQGALGGITVGAGAVTAKVVALCVAVGGTTAICVEVNDRLHDGPAKATAPTPRTARIIEPPREHVEVVRLPKPTTTTTTTKTKRSARRETPVSSKKSAPPASPAPKGSTEFGPGSLGSTSAPKQPAAAPQDGGGEFTP